MKNNIRRISCLLGLLTLLAILVQCATVSKESPSPFPGRKTQRTLSEIESLKKAADKDSDPSVRAQAALELAKLYSFSGNPKPDYEQALKRLEMYLSFHPAEGETDEMRNWLSLLRDLVKGRERIIKATQTINQLTKENEEMEKENEELAVQNKELTRENKELKDTVKALKNIDIKMEEKRKQIK